MLGLWEASSDRWKDWGNGRVEGSREVYKHDLLAGK